jgi:hypothetical protein
LTRRPLILAASALLAACSAQQEACGGTLVTVPEGGGEGYTIPQLMAQAAAMGMTNEEAQTLIYLEGLSPQATLQPGETICLAGQPDR